MVRSLDSVEGDHGVHRSLAVFQRGVLPPIGGRLRQVRYRARVLRSSLRRLRHRARLYAKRLRLQRVLRRVAQPSRRVRAALFPPFPSFSLSLFLSRSHSRSSCCAALTSDATSSLPTCILPTARASSPRLFSSSSTSPCFGAQIGAWANSAESSAASHSRTCRCSACSESSRPAVRSSSTK